MERPKAEEMIKDNNVATRNEMKGDQPPPYKYSFFNNMSDTEEAARPLPTDAHPTKNSTPTSPTSRNAAHLTISDSATAYKIYCIIFIATFCYTLVCWLFAYSTRTCTSAFAINY